MIETILAPQGYDIYKAHGGREALRMLDICRSGPILMEVMTSDLDGYEVTKAPKEKDLTKVIAIVVVSAAF